MNSLSEKGATRMENERTKPLFGGTRPKSGDTIVRNTNKLTQDATSGMNEARSAAVISRLAEVPATMKRAYLRAVGGKSRPNAIRAFCAECVGWERAEVRACTALACPLYAYRPFQKRAKP